MSDLRVLIVTVMDTIGRLNGQLACRSRLGGEVCLMINVRSTIIYFSFFFNKTNTVPAPLISWLVYQSAASEAPGGGRRGG